MSCLLHHSLAARFLVSLLSNVDVIHVPPPYPYPDTEKNEPASKYWSFSMAVEHGFIDTDFPDDACIHPPATDWAEPLDTDGSSGGDATLAAGQAPAGVTARVDGNSAAAVGVSVRLLGG